MPFYCTTVGKDTKNERNIKTKYGYQIFKRLTAYYYTIIPIREFVIRKVL